MISLSRAVTADDLPGRPDKLAKVQCCAQHRGRSGIEKWDGRTTVEVMVMIVCLR